MFFKNLDFKINILDIYPITLQERIITVLTVAGTSLKKYKESL